MVSPKTMQPEGLSFQQLTKRTGGILLISKSEEIIKLELVGTVDAKTAKYLIGYTFQQLKLNGYTKLLINRTNPHTFTDEANSWMKDFLLGNRHRFELKLTRVAIVSLESKSIGLYAHFMKTAFQVIFPGVKIASFEFEDSAVEWIK